MAAKGPKHSKAEDTGTPNASIIKFVNHIYDQFIKNPHYLHLEGLLRISGEHDEVQRLVHTYKENDELPELYQLNIHAVVGCLKKLILEFDASSVLGSQAYQDFYEKFHGSLIGEEVQSFEFFESFVDTLATSSRRDYNEVAEIIYSLIRLGQLIASQHVYNKMNAENCARILGPNLYTLLKVHQTNAFSASLLATSSSLDDFLTKTAHMNQMINHAIGSDFYQEEFQDKYREQQIEAREQARRQFKRNVHQSIKSSRVLHQELQQAQSAASTVHPKSNTSGALIRLTRTLSSAHIGIGPTVPLTRNPNSNHDHKEVVIERNRAMSLRAVLDAAKRERQRFRTEAERLGGSVRRLRISEVPMGEEDTCQEEGSVACHPMPTRR